MALLSATAAVDGSLVSGSTGLGCRRAPLQTLADQPSALRHRGRRAVACASPAGCRHGSSCRTGGGSRGRRHLRPSLAPVGGARTPSERAWLRAVTPTPTTTSGRRSSTLGRWWAIAPISDLLPSTRRRRPPCLLPLRHPPGAVYAALKTVSRDANGGAATDRSDGNGGSDTGQSDAHGGAATDWRSGPCSQDGLGTRGSQANRCSQGSR